MKKSTKFLFFVILGTVISLFLCYKNESYVSNQNIHRKNPLLLINPQDPVIINDNQLQISSDRIYMELDLTNYGRILSVRNIVTQQTLKILGLSHEPWMLEFIDGSWIYSSNSIGFSYYTTATNAELNYSCIKGGIPFNVSLQYQVDDPHPGVNMRIFVRSNDELSGIKRVFFPNFNALNGWSNNPGMERIAVPEREGWLFTEPIITFKTEGYSSTYPGTLSMQFMVLEEPDVGGFVLSARDNRSNFKGIEILPDGVDRFKINWFHYGEYSADMWENFNLDYWMVLDGYIGCSWAFGADQYKSWALQQWYVEKGPIFERDDIPSWLKNLNYVWKSSSYATHNGKVVLEGDTVDRMGEYAPNLKSKGLSSNFLLDWWGWQKGGHDNDYPEFFPARDGNDKLITGISNAHNYDTRVMLYLNGRLVDIDTPTYANHLANMTGFYTSIYQETYSPYFTAAVADPASSWWQKLMANISTRCVDEFHADAVYLDQISVAPPVFDYRPESITNHPLGGGSWWQEAENTMLSQIQSKFYQIDQNKVLASENIIETYLNTIDLFWTYSTSYQFAGWFPEGKSIPMFNYIYHKYAITNGRADISPTDISNFRWAVSEEILAGCLPGGTGDLSVISSLPMESCQLLQNAYNTRRIANFQFFRDGDLLAPISWKDCPTITVSDYSFQTPQGVIQGFKGSDGNIAFLFINRGSTLLEWKGYLTDILKVSGLDNSLIEVSRIHEYRNGFLINLRNVENLITVILNADDYVLLLLDIEKYDIIFAYPNSVILFSILLSIVGVVLWVNTKKKIKKTNF